MKRHKGLTTERDPITPLGTKMRWGRIRAVGIISGERHYWMIDKHRGVAMMPADAVEPKRVGVAAEHAFRLMKAKSAGRTEVDQ